MRHSLSQYLFVNTLSRRSYLTLVVFLHEQQYKSVHFVTVLLTTVYILCLFCVASTYKWTPLAPALDQRDYKKLIINQSILRHPWECAIFLKEYQFLTVVYKVFPSVPLMKKFCGNLFNGTEINASSWYTE